MKRRRILEIIPGFVSWNLILFLIWGGYFFPVVTAYFILAFDVFWVWKGFSMTVATFISHLRIKAAERLDWMREVKGFGDWERVKHVVMIMIANEPLDTYAKTIEALTRQTFPLKQIAVIMATEERYPKGFTGAESLGKTLGKEIWRIPDYGAPGKHRG